jgi:hypothetical protein
MRSFPCGERVRTTGVTRKRGRTDCTSSNGGNGVGYGRPHRAEAVHKPPVGLTRSQTFKRPDNTSCGRLLMGEGRRLPCLIRRGVHRCFGPTISTGFTGIDNDVLEKRVGAKEHDSRRSR